MNPHALSRSEVRAIDRKAIETFGLPGIVLMENAGRGIAELIVELGVSGPVVVCAGKGNNGGDGFVIARHLENRGYDVRVLLFCSPDELAGDAAVNYRVLTAARTPLAVMTNPPASVEIDRELAGAVWIVDALLGTGTQGTIREPFVTAIDRMNRSNAKIMAVDLPSGLDCDTGEPLGVCVRAHYTATLVAPKLGFVPHSSQWTGRVHVIDIGIPRVLLQRK